MKLQHSPMISIEELKKLLLSNNIIILDARAGKYAEEQYLKKHLKGARFIDLEKDLANVPADASKGGRHPLPDLFDFAKTLSDLGIAEDTPIVIYDDKNGANAAARCWWMLRAFGIVNAQVLDGGFQLAEEGGLEMSSGEEHIHSSVVKIPGEWQWKTATIQEVEQKLANQTATVIDVRDAYRYNGESEPIDPVAGHIPGAINIPFTKNLDENGLFLSPEKLKELYSSLANKEVIVHCGSGVTACHTILAMASAGFEIPTLYIGSWSEWCRSGREVALS